MFESNCSLTFFVEFDFSCSLSLIEEKSKEKKIEKNREMQEKLLIVNCCNIIFGKIKVRGMGISKSNSKYTLYQIHTEKLMLRHTSITFN